MSMHSGAGETDCPEVVLASIAWYPDALDEERRGLVEAHAASCAACREELAFVQGVVEPQLPLPDADDVYAGVLERIERSEASSHPAAQAPGRATPRPRRSGRRVNAARPAALAAGIALALLSGGLGALGALLFVSGSGSDARYETAVETPEPVTSIASAGPALDVVFRADARSEQVQAALRAIGGQIVAGPTPIGVYRIELPADADRAAAARLLEGEGRGVAAFAQPAR